MEFVKTHNFCLKKTHLFKQQEVREKSKKLIVTREVANSRLYGELFFFLKEDK